MAIVYWYKKRGETLKKSLERFRDTYAKYSDSKITYAGRLDPLADGILLLLTDDDVHKKNDFLKKDKVYEVSFILGVETDSFDILGIPNADPVVKDIQKNDIKREIEKLVHITTQIYPPYSSKPVSGKPLWRWAREGKLDTIKQPIQQITIYTAELVDIKNIAKSDLEQRIFQDIEKVDGDFRQDIIVQKWKEYFFVPERTSYQMVTMRVEASSGTYMRSLVDYLGKRLGTLATTFSISRTKLGNRKLTKDYISDNI